jgi:alpha-ribazole phosphatase
MKIELPSPAPGATRLVLIRHGEPDLAFRDRCYGRLDPGLSPAGREQMRQTWTLLDAAPTAIYCSPSRRAVDSAIVRSAARPSVTVDARLAEIDFGAFEGLTYDEISRRYPEAYAKWMAAPTEVMFPDGESFAAMAARVRQAMDHIRAAHAGGTVAIVAHGGVNRVALASALGLDPRHIFRLAQGYACLNVIDYSGDDAIVRLMNVTAAPC